MAPVRRLNRASKPRAYQRQQSEFIIYTEPPNPNSQSLDNPNTQPHAGLNIGLNHDESLDSSDDEGLDSSDNEGLDLSDNEGLYLSDNESLVENLAEDPMEGLIEGPIESLTEDLAKDLITQFCNEIENENSSRQLYENLGVPFPDNQPYQPPFLPKDRAGKPQNLPENPDPIKLFQLFFPVKEIENIVKQTNQRATYIDFSLKSPWKPLTITEAYRYLGCLIYIGIQPLRELEDHWSQLNSPIKSCLSQKRFKQIRRAFTIRDPNTSPQRPEDPWWFRLEPLATTIREACQKYWIPGAHIAVDECMVPYFGHTQHTIKAPYKPIKQGFKIWCLGDCGYTLDWRWYSKKQGTEGLGLKSRENTMADTQALVLSLAKSLPDLVKGYTLYLDNLFPSIPLAIELGKLGIGVMCTARLSTLGLPSSLKKLKRSNEVLNWGHLHTAIIKRILCFLWVDNNRVLGKILT